MALQLHSLILIYTTPVLTEGPVEQPPPCLSNCCTVTL